MPKGSLEIHGAHRGQRNLYGFLVVFPRPLTDELFYQAKVGPTPQQVGATEDRENQDRAAQHYEPKDSKFNLISEYFLEDDTD